MKLSANNVERVRTKLKMRVAEFVDGNRTNGSLSPMHLHALKEHLRQALKSLSPEEYRTLCISRVGEEEPFLDDLLNESLGLGSPLDEILKDPTVTEVMVNGPSEIFVERQGHLTRAGSDIMAETYSQSPREVAQRMERARQFHFLVRERRTLAQAALQFLLQLDGVTAVLPRLFRRQDLKEVLGTLTAEPLTQGELARIASRTTALEPAGVP